MALIYADRVQELSITEGTGDMTMSASVDGWQTFLLGIGDGNTTYYCITDGTDWEVGLGTFTSPGADVFARDTVYESSIGDALIDWPAGEKTIFTVLPSAILDGSVVSDLQSANSLLLQGNNTAYHIARGNHTGQVTLATSTSDHATVVRLTGVQTLVNKILTLPKLLSGTIFDCVSGILKNIKTASFIAEVANTSSTTTTINWNSGQKQKLTLSSTITTLNFTDPPGPCNLMLRVINGASWNISNWETPAIQWVNGGTVPPVTPSGTDICAFYFDGAIYHGSWGQNSTL